LERDGIFNNDVIKIPAAKAPTIHSQFGNAGRSDFDDAPLGRLRG